jgi:DNA-directed RNA polymerase subunit H (RpoH/RPB5)
MAPHSSKLVFRLLRNRLVSSGYTVEDHRDPQSEASIRATGKSANVHVTLFATGAIRVVPSGATECVEIKEQQEECVRRLKGLAEGEISVPAYEFLEEADRESILASFSLCENTLPLVEYSALVMPLARAFEGFVKKLLICLGAADPVEIDDPIFLRKAFGGASYKKLLANHEDKQFLERLQKNLPFCRHGLVHSPAHNEFVLHSLEQALSKKGEILTIIRETFQHFRTRL